jgi:hypothetical protein
MTNIANELQSYKNPSLLRREPLRLKINRILKIKSVKDRLRCGTPRTVRIERLRKAAKSLIHLRCSKSKKSVYFIINHKSVHFLGSILYLYLRF